MSSGRVTVMRGQALWDLAIQCYGSVEGVFALIQDNADQLASLDDDLHPGQVLRVRTAPVDRDLATYYKDNDLHPVSGEQVPLGGAFDAQEYDHGYDNQEAPE